MTDLAPSKKKQLLAEILQIVHRQQSDEEIGYFDACQLDFDKWQKLHKLIHASRFPTNRRLKRSEQWRVAVNQVRHIGDTELMNWCLLQVEVAANRERGIRDLRPRKDGPCWELLLDFVSDRKRKALAILHFAGEGEKHGLNIVDSKWHAQTADILKRYNLIETDEDGNRIYSNDPMARS